MILQSKYGTCKTTDAKGIMMITWYEEWGDWIGAVVSWLIRSVEVIKIIYKN